MWLDGKGEKEKTRSQKKDPYGAATLRWISQRQHQKTELVFTNKAFKRKGQKTLDFYYFHFSKSNGKPRLLSDTFVSFCNHRFVMMQPCKSTVVYSRTFHMVENFYITVYRWCHSHIADFGQNIHIIIIWKARELSCTWYSYSNKETKKWICEQEIMLFWNNVVLNNLLPEVSCYC
jgi:hypothetical protein